MKGREMQEKMRGREMQEKMRGREMKQEMWREIRSLDRNGSFDFHFISLMLDFYCTNVSKAVL